MSEPPGNGPLEITSCLKRGASPHRKGIRYISGMGPAQCLDDSRRGERREKPDVLVKGGCRRFALSLNGELTPVSRSQTRENEQQKRRKTETRC